MMKHLNLNSIEKYFVLIISNILFASTACNKVSEKSNNETVIEAPSTTIHEATFFGNTKDVKQHIAAKTDLNQKDVYGSTPLHIAATFGKTDIAILLINAGADLNEPNGDGSTPLHTAAFLGRTEIVKALLENKADVSLRNNYNSTALESVSGSFEDAKPIYDQLSRDLGPLGLKLDYDQLKINRKVIAELIKSSSK